MRFVFKLYPKPKRVKGIGIKILWFDADDLSGALDLLINWIHKQPKKLKYKYSRAGLELADKFPFNPLRDLLK